MQFFKKPMLFLALMAAIGLVFTACDDPGASKASLGYDQVSDPGANIDNRVDANGAIEETYATAGSYAVDTTSITGYKIFYPRDMQGDHPIITWGNGTAAPTFLYNALLTHLASWGFVVIASNSTMAGSGEEMVGGIDYLIQQNSESGSIFHNMLDTGSIGTIGHSQGGAGAINAATDARVTCTAPLAPTPAQITQVVCPTFLVAGSSDFIVPAASVRDECYVPATAPTIFGIIQGVGHLEFMGSGGRSRGYVTAWFMYHLQDDQLAQQAFESSGELFNNSDWVVERKNY